LSNDGSRVLESLLYHLRILAVSFSVLWA